MLAYGDTELAPSSFTSSRTRRSTRRATATSTRRSRPSSRTRACGAGLRTEGRPAELEKFLALRKRQGEAAELMVAARARLAAIYAQPLAPEVMRDAKAAEFARLREALAAGGLPRRANSTTRAWSPSPLMSAACRRCAASSTRLGNDLPAFYAAMNGLGRQPEGARQPLSRSLTPRSVAARSGISAGSRRAAAAGCRGGRGRSPCRRCRP